MSPDRGTRALCLQRQHAFVGIGKLHSDPGFSCKVRSAYPGYADCLIKIDVS